MLAFRSHQSTVYSHDLFGVEREGWREKEKSVSIRTLVPSLGTHPYDLFNPN